MDVDRVDDVPRSSWISAIFVYLIAKQFMSGISCF